MNYYQHQQNLNAQRAQALQHYDRHQRHLADVPQSPNILKPMLFRVAIVVVMIGTFGSLLSLIR